MEQAERAQRNGNHHRPVRRELDGAGTAIVFIHGLMGSPGQFSDWMEAVYAEGYSCFSVLLPGHGVCMSEFARFGDRDWQRHVLEEIAAIRGRYSRIVLVGHSLGGLLALSASLDVENHISGVILLSAPLKINWLRPRALWQKLRLLMLPKDHEIKAAYLKANGITKSHLLSYPLAVKPVISLLRLIRRLKKQLPGVFVPVYLFYSEKDETVSPKSAKLFSVGLRNTNITVFPLRRSWHAYYDGSERSMILEQMLAFVRQNGME